MKNDIFKLLSYKSEHDRSIDKIRKDREIKIKEVKLSFANKLKTFELCNKVHEDNTNRIITNSILLSYAKHFSTNRDALRKTLNFDEDIINYYSSGYRRVGESSSIHFSRGFDALVYAKPKIIKDAQSFNTKVPIYVTWESGNRLSKSYTLHDALYSRFSNTTALEYSKLTEDEQYRLFDEELHVVRSGKIVNIYDHHFINVGDSDDIRNFKIVEYDEHSIVVDLYAEEISNVTGDAFNGSSFLIQLSIEELNETYNDNLSLQIPKAPRTTSGFL